MSASEALGKRSSSTNDGSASYVVRCSVTFCATQQARMVALGTQTKINRRNIRGRAAGIVLRVKRGLAHVAHLRRAC